MLAITRLDDGEKLLHGPGFGLRLGEQATDVRERRRRDHRLGPGHTARSILLRDRGTRAARGPALPYRHECGWDLVCSRRCPGGDALGDGRPEALADIAGGTRQRLE